MFSRQKAHERDFHSVALFFILLGAAAFATGFVQWLFNHFYNCLFIFPKIKMILGLFTIGFGYIILELELIRTQSRKKD